MEHVFGYGSLTVRDGVALAPCTLHGWRRTWGVAMDNRVLIPGYKVWEDPATGERPAVEVCFLDVRPAPGAMVAGAVRAVDAPALARLDARERNYVRVEVTGALDRDPDGRVWVYVGRAVARRRAAAGRRAGTAVVAGSYLALVRAGFEALGLAEAFDAGTDPPGVPVLDLRRVDLP